jgi:hypothetical protein
MHIPILNLPFDDPMFWVITFFYRIGLPYFD